MDDLLRRRNVRVGLVVISIVAAASMGGGFVAGVVLVPALVMASRHASPYGATGYGALSAVLAAEVGWALTYVVVGERQPYIWLLPAVLVVLTIGVSVWTYERRPPGQAPAVDNPPARSRS